MSSLKVVTISLAAVAVAAATPTHARAQSSNTVVSLVKYGENSDQSTADSAAVRRAVLDYVEGFYEGDSTKFVRSVRPDVFKYGFWRPRDSMTYQGEQMKFAEFNAFANRVKASGRKAPPNTRKDVTLFDVQDRTASAKLTAYWGTDYLLLGKFGETWMVTSVLWQSPPPPQAP
jgi:hypothetical protein